MECSRRKAFYRGRRIRAENPPPTRLNLSGTLAPEVLVRLNAQLRLTVHLHQVILENRFRDVDGREDVRYQAYNERNGEPRIGPVPNTPKNAAETTVVT